MVGPRRRRRCRRRRGGWLANVARAVCCATVPSVARKTWPGGGLVAQRLEAGAVATDVVPRRRCGSRSGSVSPRFGNSVRPVIGRLRLAISASRLRDRRRRSRASRSAPSSRRPKTSQAATGQVVGELLDGVRAAGRVGDVGDVRLVDEQVGGVAGDPAAEGVGAAERAVERQHGDAVRSPDAGGEGRDRGAEHVDPGVVLAHHRAAGDGVQAHLAGGRRSLSSSTRAQSRRAARSLAIVGNCSSVAA